jgi:hypothetical protein
VIIRRFIVPMVLSAMTALCAEAAAQGSFPAPLPNQSGEPPSAIYPPPSANGTGSWPPPSDSPVPAEQDKCWTKFGQLRQDSAQRAQAIKAASERRAAPQEACGLLKTYVQAEAELVSYVTTRQTACGIPAAIQEQLKANQKRSNDLMTAVCAAASHRSPGDQFPASGPVAQRRTGAQLGR